MINGDDVVQGITSGNETPIKRISIDGLNKVLGGREMMNVTRGSYGKCVVHACSTGDRCSIDQYTDGMCWYTGGGYCECREYKK